jgi:arylformamidase
VKRAGPILLAIVAALSVGVPAPAQPSLAGRIVSSLDIPYSEGAASDPNPRLRSLDIHAPEGAACLPVMVFIHGGTWFQGDKGRLDGKASAFVEAGWVFVSVNYRLSSDVMHPVHAQDLAEAIAWIRASICGYGGDPRRIFLMGHSAGGHLAALVATDPAYLGERGLSLDSIRGVIGLDSAAYDLAALFRAEPENLLFFEMAFGDDPGLWESASPLSHVSPGKGIPPFLLAYAGDREISREAALEFGGALEKAGLRVTYVPMPDRDHVGIERLLGSPGDFLFLRIMEFLNGVTKL